MKTFDLVKKILYQTAKLGPELEITDLTQLDELGLDSLDTFELVYCLEDELGISIDLSVLEKNPTIGSLCEGIDEIILNEVVS